MQPLCTFALLFASLAFHEETSVKDDPIKNPVPGISVLVLISIRGWLQLKLLAYFMFTLSARLLEYKEQQWNISGK